jgi:hypothetical protein
MNALHQTFWQFTAALSEYLDQRVVEHHLSAVFSMYAAGATIQQAAQAITEIDRRPDL